MSGVDLRESGGLTGIVVLGDILILGEIAILRIITRVLNIRLVIAVAEDNNRDIRD
jgi:hypothetical protein